MELTVKICTFVAVALILNYIVNLIFKFMSRKTKAIHLRFSNRAVNLIIDIIIVYSLAQQFEIT